MEITNKVAIVTGGIHGIGLATVQFLLRNGAEYVGIFDWAKSDSSTVDDGLKTLEKEFKKDKFDYYVTDVRNEKEFAANYDKIIEQKNYVDILVNNAGVACENDADVLIDVNLKGVVKCTMAAIERMGKQNQNKDGVIVNIASYLGLVNAPPLFPVYNATKHGVVSFVRSMGVHNKTLGVRIVCICPGMTKTGMVEPATLNKNKYDFISTEDVNNELSTLYLQNPDNVALGIVEIIKKGNEGDVWVAQNDEPPFAVGEETDLEKLRIAF